MKRIFCVAVTALAIGLISTSNKAYASACSNASLRGTYVFTLHGQIFLGDGSTLTINGVAKQTFDGNGNFRQVDAVATNGIMTPGWRPGSGTYSVNADCTGTQTIVVSGIPDVHLQFVIAQSGNRIHQVVTDAGIATTAEGERLQAPTRE
jgi:hypothetical protein